MARTNVATIAKKTRKSPQRRTKQSSGGERLIDIPVLDRRMTVRSFFNRLKAHPMAMYLGGGAASILIMRLGYRYYKSHPEIKQFLMDNFDTVEDKLREYKNSFGSDVSEARH